MVDGEEISLPKGTYPAEDILKVADRTPGVDTLIWIDDRFRNGFAEVTKVKIEEGMEFSARPPTGQAT